MGYCYQAKSILQWVWPNNTSCLGVGLVIDLLSDIVVVSMHHLVVG